MKATRMITRRLPLFIAVAAFASLAANANAANLEAGKKFASDVCVACHGVDGNPANPDYPKLGGQHADYLAKTLRDYQSGARNNAIMKGFAASLSVQDMEDLAAWFSTQKSSLHFQR